MIKVKVSYSTQEEKEKFIADMLRLQNYKILTVTKEHPGKGKSTYKRVYIDLLKK